MSESQSKRAGQAGMAIFCLNPTGARNKIRNDSKTIGEVKQVPEFQLPFSGGHMMRLQCRRRLRMLIGISIGVGCLPCAR